MKNKYEIRGDVTAIFLKRLTGEIHECLIDTTDLKKLQDFGYTWNAKYSTSTKSYYATTTIKTDGKKKTYLMHRFITDCPDDMHVDHRNHNTLDNRSSQLRIVTRNQNMQNTKSSRANNYSSGYRGVSWDKQCSKWLAYLTVNKKRMFLGHYESVEGAKSVVESARSKLMHYSIESENKINFDDLKLPKKQVSSEKQSGIKGISWNKEFRKWRFRPTIGIKRVLVDYFVDLEKAKLMYYQMENCKNEEEKLILIAQYKALKKI